METNQRISIVIMRSNPKMEERYDFKKAWRAKNTFVAGHSKMLTEANFHREEVTKC